MTGKQDSVFVIGGYNGLRSVQAWVRQLLAHSNEFSATAYSWRDARSAARDIAALPRDKSVTLIGHSLGGGHAELIAQRLPAGSIDVLITVAPFAPARVNRNLIRRNVGCWLNIASSPDRRDWQDMARKLAAPLFLDWREQGIIRAASENYVSRFPHHDFYKMMGERCGAVEHGGYQPIRAGRAL